MSEEGRPPLSILVLGLFLVVAGAGVAALVHMSTKPTPKEKAKAASDANRKLSVKELAVIAADDAQTKEEKRAQDKKSKNRSAGDERQRQGKPGDNKREKERD